MSETMVDQKKVENAVGDHMKEDVMASTESSINKKKKNLSPIKRFFRFVYKKRYSFLAIAIILTVSIILFGNNFQKIYELQQQKQFYENGILEEEEKAKRLKIEFKNVENRSHIERIAREKLGMVYPDEIIVTPVIEGDMPAQEPGKE